MKLLQLEEAKGSLSDYARKNRRGAVVVTRNGKPILLLFPWIPEPTSSGSRSR